MGLASMCWGERGEYSQWGRPPSIRSACQSRYGKPNPEISSRGHCGNRSVASIGLDGVAQAVEHHGQRTDRFAAVDRADPPVRRPAAQRADRDVLALARQRQARTSATPMPLATSPWIAK